MPYKDLERRKQASADHYESNKSSYKARAKDTRVAFRDEINKIKEARGCADCRIPYPYKV